MPDRDKEPVRQGGRDCDGRVPDPLTQLLKGIKTRFAERSRTPDQKSLTP